MDPIDLTLTDDEDDDIVVIKSKITEQYQNNKPRSSQIDKDVYSFFYGTEDKTQEFLAIQHPAARKIVRKEYTIYCPKCHKYFSNINFVNHIIDHFNIELNSLDRLLVPNLDNVMNCQEWCAVKCEICDIKFTSLITLGQHLQKKHVYKDMPYACFVCNFYRTSFLPELKQHFYDYHKFTEYLACPLCIEIFELQPLSCGSNILDAYSFVAHLDKHMNKRQFSCDKCALKYFSKTDLIYHRTIYHEGRNVPEKEEDIGEDITCRSTKVFKKSLNVTSQPIDINKLSINVFKLPFICSECRESITNFPGHFQSYIMCSQCGFSSYCAASFRRHTRAMHGSISAEISTNTMDLYNSGIMMCPCGFQSLHGDKVAQHLTVCHHKICVTRPRQNVTGPFKRSRCSLSNDDNIFKILKLRKLMPSAE